MNGRLRLLGACACAIAFSTCASAPTRPDEPRSPGRGTIRVTITGFRNGEGQVLVALFLSAEGWPDDATSAFGRVALPIRRGEASAAFEDVPAGRFALSAFHDADMDGVLDTGLFGIPSEDYGFSRDARGTFGPPSFEEARLDLAAGQAKHVTIRVE